MGETKYKVLIDNTIIAQDMDINTATILIRALFEEYYNDDSMKVIIEKMEKQDKLL